MDEPILATTIERYRQCGSKARRKKRVRGMRLVMAAEVNLRFILEKMPKEFLHLCGRRRAVWRLGSRRVGHVVTGTSTRSGHLLRQHDSIVQQLSIRENAPNERGEKIALLYSDDRKFLDCVGAKLAEANYRILGLVFPPREALDFDMSYTCLLIHAER